MPKNAKAKTKSALKILQIGLISTLVITILGLIISMSIVPSRKSDLRLEYALSGAEQLRGLSGRDDLAADKAMLFVYEKPAERCMWMREMRFSIDIVWLNADKQIIKIAEDVSPATFPESFCTSNSQYVLELKSGGASKYGYKVGDYLKL